jgi:branched-chain amino acid transport system substrate-binding protein
VVAPSAGESPLFGDRYELKGELGRGAFAVVYRARDRFTDEDVAIKVLRSPSREAVARFRRELRAARKVTHPGVVRIHDLIEVGDRVALSMELVEGETLQERIERAGPLDSAELTLLAVDLARALAALHRAGVTHRDLKPHNIILRASNQRAVIADFGVSRLSAGEPVSPLAKTLDPTTDLNQSGTIAGTPLFMAPEQLLGRAEVGPPADVYALGIVLLAAAAGKPPHEEANTLDELRRARETAPPSVPPGVPPLLGELIARCLQIDPAQRFADGIAVREALVPLAPMAGETRGYRKLGRRRTGLWAALSALILLTGGFALWWRSARPVGCGETYGADGKNRIVLGVAMPVGPDTRQLFQAMRMAVDEVNQREGVGYRPLQLAFCDTAHQRARLRAQVDYLAQRAPAVITGGSDETLAATSIAFPAGVLVMSPTATSPELRDVASPGGARLLWRATPSDEAQGAAMAEVLLHDPAFSGVKKVALFYRDDLYGQGLAAVVRARLRGLEVVAVQYPAEGSIDRQIDLLDAAQPQVTVLVSSLGGLERRILDLAAKRPHLRRTAGHRWMFSENAKPDTELLAQLEHPEELDGSYATEPAHGAGDAYSSFVARFRARFGAEPSSPFTAHSYDSIYLIALAAARAAGPDGKTPVTGRSIGEGFTHLSSGKHFLLSPEQLTPAKTQLLGGGSIDVDGASGALDMDAASGEPASPITLSRLRGKQFEDIRQIEIR